MTLASFTSGTGPACALVHGWGLSSAVWGPLEGQLRAELRCQRIDMPGHGSSAPLDGGLKAWARALADTVDGPATWVGWSLGGLLSLQVAMDAPELVNGLVLIGATPRFTRAPDWPCATPQSQLEDFAAALETHFDRTLGRFLTLQVYGGRSVPAEGRQLLRDLRAGLLETPPAPAGLRQGLDILRDTDLRPEVAGIDVPARVISGGRDRLSHPDAGDWLAQHLPRARGLRLEDAAHAPFLSHTKAVADVIREVAGL